MGTSLLEEDFSLEFLTLSDGIRNWIEVLNDAVGENGYVLQQRVVLPRKTCSRLLQSLSHLSNPGTAAPPLVLLGHEDHPGHYQAIIAKPKQVKTKIMRIRGATKLSADGLRMLISDPVYTDSVHADPFHTSFNKISEVLAVGKMVETDLVRIWLYPKDISRNYSLLNETRKKYFARVLGSRPRLPASTGVQGVSSQHSPLSLMFWAAAGKNITIHKALSPLQCEPTNYAVLFSRAIGLKFRSNTLLLISGTASIDYQGRTIHTGNCAAQMDHTLTVLSNILSEQGGSFENIVQAVIYIKREQDINECLNSVRKAGFPVENALVQVAELCREDLLCEIEAHAVIRN